MLFLSSMRPSWIAVVLTAWVLLFVVLPLVARWVAQVHGRRSEP